MINKHKDTRSVHLPSSSNISNNSLYLNVFKEKREKTQKLRRLQFTRKIAEIKKLLNHCEICGYNGCPEILEFHHLNPLGKKYMFIGRELGNSCWNTIIKELQKCILICPTCHRKLHFDMKYKKNIWEGSIPSSATMMLK